MVEGREAALSEMGCRGRKMDVMVRLPFAVDRDPFVALVRSLWRQQWVGDDMSLYRSDEDRYSAGLVALEPVAVEVSAEEYYARRIRRRLCKGRSFCCRYGVVELHLRRASGRELAVEVLCSGQDLPCRATIRYNSRIQKIPTEGNRIWLPMSLLVAAAREGGQLLIEGRRDMLAETMTEKRKEPVTVENPQILERLLALEELEGPNGVREMRQRAAEGRAPLD